MQQTYPTPQPSWARIHSSHCFEISPYSISSSVILFLSSLSSTTAFFSHKSFSHLSSLLPFSHDTAKYHCVASSKPRFIIIFVLVFLHVCAGVLQRPLRVGFHHLTPVLLLDIFHQMYWIDGNFSCFSSLPSCFRTG